MLSTKTGKATHLLTGGALALIASLAVTTARADEAVPQNDLLNATLWMQKSVEYKATVMGLFDLAKLRLDAALADPEWSAVPDKEGKDYQKLPVAIISDLDETLLDNNVYEASLVTRNKGFSGKEWTQYVKDEVTKATPGAVDFLKYAASKGVKIFYVTNRNAEEKEATKANIEKLGFPMGGNVDTLLVKGQQPDWT
ncbi:5-nucleotide phosphatase, partial [Thioclava sp. BHET1]